MTTPIAPALIVPETLEGWSLLHQFFRVEWPAVGDASEDDRRHLADELSAWLTSWSGGDQGSSIAVAMLGHKADLMLVHARRTFDDLLQAQLDISRLGIAPLLEATTSYVSVVELGMYDMTAKIHEQLVAQGRRARHRRVRAGQSGAHADAGHARQRTALHAVPAAPLCLLLPDGQASRRARRTGTACRSRRAPRMMSEHGLSGAAMPAPSRQIISGSIGFDDWEWGVDLFADDPLVFKKLIYEMRFDEASADYGEFGPFYVGMQFAASDVGAWLVGRVPQLGEPSAPQT